MIGHPPIFERHRGYRRADQCRLHADQRRLPTGQSMVEVALILPVILLLLIGITELGRAVQAYSTVAFAARAGADYASFTTVVRASDLGPSFSSSPFEAWQLDCNLGGIVGSPKSYAALAVACSGWPNIVSTVARRGQGIDLSRATVDIEYRDPPVISPQTLSRGVPVIVTVTYSHPILFAGFIGVPTTVQIQSSSEKLTQ